MAFPLEHKIFMIKPYFRNRRKINGVWEYSIQAAWDKFRKEFPNNIVRVTKFRETSFLQRKKGSGRSKDKRTPEKNESIRQIMERTATTSVRFSSTNGIIVWNLPSNIAKRFTTTTFE